MRGRGEERRGDAREMRGDAREREEMRGRERRCAGDERRCAGDERMREEQVGRQRAGACRWNRTLAHWHTWHTGTPADPRTHMHDACRRRGGARLPLGLEDGFVDHALVGRELAVDRVRARDVGAVAVVLGAHIEQCHLPRARVGGRRRARVRARVELGAGRGLGLGLGVRLRVRVRARARAQAQAQAQA